MARVYLSLGSNINREYHLRGAIAALRDSYGKLDISKTYENPAVGFDGDDFYNLVVGLDSDDDVLTINQRIHDIEQQFGRDRSQPKFSSRTLDIDLLLYDDLIFKQGKLELPRDEITKYAFVLRPLAELAPDAHHPQINKSFIQLWQEFDDSDTPLTEITLTFE